MIDAASATGDAASPSPTPTTSLDGSRADLDEPLSPGRFVNYRWRGLVIAALVYSAWGAALVTGLLGANPGAGNVWADAPWVLLQAWLYTGLFITAHEAMHGLVAPMMPRLNHFIGWLSLTLFAALPYFRMRAAHGQHHRTPSTDDDPDYYDGKPPPLIGWYARFMLHYLTWWQIVIMAGVYNLLVYAAGLPIERVIVFWIVPQFLSTFQLFIVGTWLPHRTGHGHFEGTGPTKTRTVSLPPMLSLLACFHFGYHYEHHAWPWIPWWRLPSVRGRRRPEDTGGTEAAG